ncbi:hypothetical protein [Methylobacterium sp. CCH5-D2]|uniref:hypothetical protein n=1 Tax=Methylobacterium sp. CCH5-D2 TaxID=1768765 RepID=UPI000AB41544|nr:hypothetical protein [Methylobacterium sp. CCH5-D2]
MNSFSDVIDALGVPGASGILGIPESHVRVLKARDSIPPDYFKRIVDSAEGQANSITFDLLYGLRDEKIAHKRPAAATIRPAFASEVPRSVASRKRAGLRPAALAGQSR